MEFRNVRVGTGGTLLEGKKYSYDARGNITMISQSTGSYYPLIAYAYDSQNQLIKETYYDGEGTGSAHVTDTYEYTYDTAGNIQSEKKNGTVTKTYTYGDSQWHDKLTAVNGRTITYDAIGNPRTYQIGRGNSWSLSWENGRQLASVERSTTSSTLLTEEKYSNAYDLDGIRSKKVSVVSKYSTSSGGGGDIMSEGDSLQGIVLPPINPPGKKLISKTTKTHTYLTQNGKIVRDTLNTIVFQMKNTRKTEVFDFIYDESGRPFALIYTNGTADPVTYYYVLNLQGDVVKLVNASGTAYATYTYDAWGNVLSSTGSMASINPLRYRGYYYDTETGFYYLQSRYYDPANHRFINADSYASTDTTDAVSCNMFAYCLNNPVNRIDPTGHDSSTDTNENGIPDYLEIRWIAMTERVKIQNASEHGNNGNITDIIKKCASSIYNNLNIGLGVGQGLYLEMVLYNSIGVGLGGYGDYGKIILENGKWTFQSETFVGIQVDVFGIEIGAVDSSLRKDNKVIADNSYFGLNPNQNSWSLFSFKAYLLFLGASIEIGFNFGGFFEDLEEIFS